MKVIKSLVSILTLVITTSLTAQETEAASETTISKQDYYTQRAAQDAKFEQEFKASNHDEEETFWEEQEAYEKDLKKRDKKAYRAYMKGKKAAYAEHYENCNNHCHHSENYYHHASFYYYRYDSYYYNQPRRSTVGISTRVSTPRISVGLF
ncbi:hypothetical protein LG651_15040 [Tamlana sp. 62-3]|uniref:Uncharacterized protein n=1 Tax=Neotamlana sargassicola TaxID=2883125 RepID=A0A9X1L8J5_9FLAO|nr:hypothetical protein [Tamlana sargassicola]MCB4809569.1 hypothetical protein [Tamlana sargassicola]